MAHRRPIAKDQIASVISFNSNNGRGGRRLVWYNKQSVPVVKAEGKTFDYNMQQWR